MEIPPTASTSKPAIAHDTPGKKTILLGNEAIARGLLEAGVSIAAAYPGTPSSEIMPTLAQCMPFYPKLHVEWSVNEKVAFEVAYAASMANVRGVAAMKHVGVNVASDSFMTAAYHGVRGGMVLISADDPSQFSSQNEQDNRYYGLHALVPVFEPSTPQEAKDMIKYAFPFSEKTNSVVLFRTTTRLNHGRADVEFGAIEQMDQQPVFDWDRVRWVCVPSNTRPQRTDLLKRMEQLGVLAETFPFTSLTIKDARIQGKRYGLVATGIAYAHLMDILQEFHLLDRVSLLKLGLVNPLPKKLMQTLMTSVDELLIVEELEPIFEEQFKAFAFDLRISQQNPQFQIHGKDLFPQQGELTPEIIMRGLSRSMGISYTIPTPPVLDFQIPPRLPQMCPACHHRNTYFVMKKVAKKLKKKFINNNDIGCYSLGVYKPLEAADTALCMGGSIGMANGFAKIMDSNHVITALLGDSTFFHSGIPPLINAVYNKNDLLVIIADNFYTSMTGGQENPSNGLLITQEPGGKISIEEVVKGCGVPSSNIWVQDAYDMEGLEKKMEEAVLAKGVRVLISRHMCSLEEMRIFKQQKVHLPLVQVDHEKCIGCQTCVRQFGCPAITFDFEARKASVDQGQCRGCKSCIYICPQGAFYMQET